MLIEPMQKMVIRSLIGGQATYYEEPKPRGSPIAATSATRSFRFQARGPLNMGNLNSLWLRRQQQEAANEPTRDENPPPLFADEPRPVVPAEDATNNPPPHHTFPYELRRTLSRIRRRISLRRTSGTSQAPIG